MADDSSPGYKRLFLQVGERQKQAEDEGKQERGITNISFSWDSSAIATAYSTTLPSFESLNAISLDQRGNTLPNGKHRPT